jgi:Rieske 2Fe-2S family protein
MSAVSELNINALIAGQRKGFSLEQDFYCSPEVFKRDMERLISRKWLLLDHVSRIPRKGDYFLYEIANDSIIIIREDENTINAFFNVCRHRGSKVCLEPEGNKKLLSCPYHAWTYGRDGALRPPRLMPADFDASLFGLHKCHVRLFHGLIFVCLSKGKSPDFDAEYGDFGPVLGFHGFEDAKIAAKRDYPNAVNWKLVVENFIECYHCATAHPEYCRVHPKDQLLAIGAGPGSGPPEALEKYQAIWDAWKAKAVGLGHPTPDVGRDEESIDMAQLVRLPINSRGFESETKDGKLGCKVLMGKFKECDHGETAFSFNPLGYILASNDFAMMARFTPRDAVNTDVQLSWLVHKDAEEAVDYDPDNLAWLWDVTIKQDKKITENNFAGIMSSRYQPGPYSTQEVRVATFIKWYLRNIS